MVNLNQISLGRPTADELEEFLGEIATMKKVGKHANIVALLGFCTVKQPLMMVMEYIGCGDLVRIKIAQILHKKNSLKQLNCSLDIFEKFVKNALNTFK